MRLVRAETDRRNIYRVQPLASDGLRLTVVGDRRERHVPDEVGDVTIKGISIRFAKGHAPAFEAGARVSVALESERLSSRAEVAARVVYAGESSSSRLFRLEFEDPSEVIEVAQREAFELFNRRGAIRGVAPASVEDFGAQILPNAIENRQREYPAAVRNISTSGICLLVDHRADAFLNQSPGFALSLRIPGASAADFIAARTCYREEDGDSVYYGCVFNWQETPNAFELIDKLTEYMLDRFDAELQSTHH